MPSGILSSPLHSWSVLICALQPASHLLLPHPASPSLVLQAYRSLFGPLWALRLRMEKIHLFFTYRQAQASLQEWGQSASCSLPEPDLFLCGGPGEGGLDKPLWVCSCGPFTRSPCVDVPPRPGPLTTLFAVIDFLMLGRLVESAGSFLNLLEEKRHSGPVGNCQSSPVWQESLI